MPALTPKSENKTNHSSKLQLAPQQAPSAHTENSDAKPKRTHAQWEKLDAQTILELADWGSC